MRKGRKQIRLPHFDYSNPKIYFVTVCSWKKNRTFGKINPSNVVLSDLGKILIIGINSQLTN